MSIAEHGQFSDREFAIEDMWLGVFSTRILASGFGQVGDGRSFTFCIQGQQLLVELYRPQIKGPVPQPEDIVAMARRTVVGVDITDERSLGAAVRDAVVLADSST